MTASTASSTIEANLLSRIHEPYSLWGAAKERASMPGGPYAVSIAAGALSSATLIEEPFKSIFEQPVLVGAVEDFVAMAHVHVDHAISRV